MRYRLKKKLIVLLFLFLTFSGNANNNNNNNVKKKNKVEKKKMEKIQEAEIRSFFPEAWLWNLHSIGETGEIVISKKVKQRMVLLTKWRLSPTAFKSGDHWSSSNLIKNQDKPIATKRQFVVENLYFSLCRNDLWRKIFFVFIRSRFPTRSRSGILAPFVPTWTLDWASLQRNRWSSSSLSLPPLPCLTLSFAMKRFRWKFKSSIIWKNAWLSSWN